MAGMFYSLHEAAEKLNISADQLKELAQEGKIREFRDGPNLLFKVDEVEALIPQFEASEPEATEPEMTELEPQAEEEEAIDFDLSDTEVPEQGETPEPEMAEPEPEAEEEEAVELNLSDTEIPEEQTPVPEAEASEPQGVEGVPPSNRGQDARDTIPDVKALEEEMPEPEVSEKEEVPSAEALEAEMEGLEEPAFEEPQEEELMPEMQAEAPEPEVPQPSETASDSDEILLAPETGSPLMSNDLTDADTALTGLGTSVLGETDQDYAITDDTMGETALPTSPTGTTPEVPLEEIEDDVNLDTFGSGSGLLDLSLQADDTSLGGILDEIYTAEEEGREPGEAGGETPAIPAEADQMIPEEGLAAPQAVPEMATLAGPMIEVAPDAQSNTLGMLLFLPLVIVIYTLVVAVAGQRGVMPSILASIQAFIWYLMGGAAVLAGLVVVAAFMFTGDRGTAAPKAKKVKVKKEKKPKEPKKPKEKKVKEPKKAKKGFLRIK
jgi:excisionase family DNA binding protein